jgi:hypothetical protein
MNVYNYPDNRRCYWHFVNRDISKQKNGELLPESDYLKSPSPKKLRTREEEELPAEAPKSGISHWIRKSLGTTPT